MSALGWRLLLLQLQLVLVQLPSGGNAHAHGSAVGAPPDQMQSRAVDTRVQLEIAEGRPRGTLVGAIPVKPGFTYRFNEPPREFILDAHTGDIRTAVVLDRESLANDRYDLVVLSSQPTYPIEVRIVVLDTNDNAPEFPEPVIAVSFSESAAAGTRLLLDAATDRDIGVNGVSDDYRIVAGNKEDKFRLEVTANPSGETSYLHLQTTGKLDRETTANYKLNISARDGGVPTRFGYLQVNVTILDVNDNPPIFDHSDYSVSLNESVSPGTQVLQVMATDNDIGDNAKITYYLADTERKFSVDPETGVITTSEPLDCPQQNCLLVDRHSKPNGGSCPKSCVFTVYARDHGTPRQDGRTYVTVNLVDANDHDPVIKFRYFPPTAEFATVDENAANGSVVAAVSVIDKDEGLNGETRVEIKSGNEMNHFRLEYSLSFDIVRVNGVLDREHTNKYNLTLVATDRGSPPRTATAFLIIHVNDVNDHEPVFEKSEYSAILSELAPTGTYVAGITATDEDSGVNAQIHYAFVSGNDHQWFQIDSHSGLITTKAALDREVQGTVELKISARDGGPNPKWAHTQLKVLVLDENDEEPRFSQSQINVSLSESTPPNTLVAMLTATDHDQGTNGSVIYSLHSDTPPGVFALDALTGQLTIKTRLDREKIPHYEVRVIAKDQGNPPQSSTASVYVTVLDVNDNNPEFYPQQYFVQVNEETPVGASIVQVKAIDLDGGDNALIKFAVESGSEGMFQIDDKTGVISLKASLINSQKLLYKLRISAKDKGDRKAEDDAIVEIIKDTHVEELDFDSYGSYSFQIQEDHDDKKPMIGREVGRVHLRNLDFHQNERYSIVYGDPKHYFKIDERSGIITTAAKIDREQQSSYLLTISARAGLSFGKTTVTITVLDENDNPPFFPREKDEVHIPENAAVGQEVFLARARDKDSGINSRIIYKLSSNPDNQFRIVESTGVIYLNRPIEADPGAILVLQVTASDAGSPPLSSKHTVVVIVDDVNDHTPVFDHTSYETSLLESTPMNDRFFMLSASDADLGANGRVSYAITEGNVEGKFGVFPDGYMYVKSPLDREDRDYYSLSVTASDEGSPPRSSVVPVVVHVIDENDNRPEFTNSTFTFRVRENEPPDSFVGKLTAIDRDIGRNAELTFSLNNGKTDFAIDPKNGFIKTLHVLDREHLLETTGQTFLTLEAIVSDNGFTRLKDKVKVNVHVTDVNDNAPEFLRLPYRVQISEGSNVGTQVMRVFTTDLDEGLNGDVFYVLSGGNEEGKFSIDEATGQVIVAKLLDRETVSNYKLTVTARDAAPEPKRLSSTAELLVDILDENDNAPVFTQTDSKISVLENTTVNTKLIQFRATDADLGVNSEVVFSITAGNRKDTFQVDSATGTLYLHKQLDYEEYNSYQLNITAYDGGNPRLSTTVLFRVEVEDCNDNPPAFPNTAIVRQIRECIPINTPIVTVTAEDPDSGVNGKITYAILKQEPVDPHRPGIMHFQINPKTGVIHTRLPIDREAVDTFRLTVVATDQAVDESARLSAEKLVTVIVEDANDNAPMFVSMNAALLPERAEDGNQVMTVVARDLDSSTNGLVTYDLVSGGSDLFRLNRNTGVVSLKRTPLASEPKFQIAVKATDEAVQSDRKSTDAYITVLTPGRPGTTGPSFSTDTPSGSVYENEPPGTSILTVSAKSHDGGDVEYYVTNVTGVGGEQADRLFDVDMKTGVVATAEVLDREAGREWYEIDIHAILINTGTPRTSKTKVRVKILDRNDSPPTFQESSLHLSVSEDMAAGQEVAVLKATDPDTPGPITYTLVSGDEGKFDVDAATGGLRLKDSLDRETRDIYKLLVRASDGVQSTEAVVTVQVLDTNDNAPAFAESAYSFDVAENAGRGWRVGRVEARDDDLGANGLLSYSVVSDWANDVFALNANTGVFTLTARLDYEEVQHYIFVVQAQDAGRPSLSSTLTVYFNVIDLNDNAPLFDPMSYSNEMLESAPPGTSVVTVTATDLDSGDNGRLEYSIASGDEEGMFRIEESNGTIYTRRELDRETRSLYNLVVVATDQATPPQARLSSTVQVSIVLKDVNDVAPAFITPNETSVAENMPAGTVVLAVKAVDRDEGRNGYIEYSLVSDQYNGLFSLGPVDGLLRVVGKLDRETKANYTLRVRAKDRGDPPLAAQANILVRVLDENDNSPVFDPKQYSASVAENASIGVSVLQISATDLDEGPNGRVRYSIVAGDDNRDFSVSEDSGMVRVAKNLNYERKSRYTLTVRADDCAEGSAARHDTALVSISVADINDNPPAFLDSPYVAYVVENCLPLPPSAAQRIIRVHAHDADTQPFNGRVRYFLKDGDADLFRVNASTGDLSLLAALDRERQPRYTLTVVAMDTGTPPLTGSGTVHIIVQDVNDHSPEFERQIYSVTIAENMPIGSTVLRAEATDKDEGLNAKIKYSLLGDNVERFMVDADLGIILTAVQLDREDTSVYYLTLIAQDCSLTEPRATAVNLTITVADENDNAPHFSSSKYTIHIPGRTQPGQFVFGARAVDDDIGMNSLITYFLGGEDAGKFTINQNTGVIKAAEELRLDDRSGGDDTVYQLEIKASDSGQEPKSAVANLVVKLWPAHLFPTITAPKITMFTLPEDVAAGRVITKINAFSPKPGSVGGVRFAIAGGNIGEALRIDSNTGEVFVSGSGLDYETAPQYEVWIEARDSDVPPLRTVIQLIINVTDANDNPPVMETSLYNPMVLEEEPPSQQVVTVHATDADSGLNGKVRYRLINDGDGAFSLDPETGEIVTNFKLDREETPSYSLVVEAVDQGTPHLTGTSTVLITVLDKNDNPPRFTRLFSVNVTENAEPGSFVIRVTSSDLDIGENANATYSFTENPGKKFAIDPIAGNVTVVGTLDRETQDEYLLKVAAVDGSWRAETPITITIQDQNDNAPEFEHSYYSFNFPELQRNVVFVGQVLATDRDKQGPNSVISYSLKHPSDLFTVDPASGELFSKRGLRYKYTALDSSPENQYSLTVLATDNGKPPMSSECLVTVNVVDANNNAPKFEQREYFSPVPEKAVTGQQILRVKAKDELDFGINAEVEYAKVGGNGSDLFSIGKSSGWISVTKSFEGTGKLNKQYVLKIRAMDHGVPPQQDQVTVTLVITGENRYSPIFTAISYQVIVPENEPVGSTIVTVAAADGDEGPNGMVRYSISSGNDQKHFMINPVTGAVSILQELDFDTAHEYKLNITATDLGFEPRHTKATLTVTLTDINDNAPSFNQTVYEAYIAENSPPKTFVYQVKAEDIDSPKNAIIQYSIVGGSGKDMFSIEMKTGIIYSKAKFDYEERQSYTVDILAVNPDSPMYGSSKVVVHVTGVNEYYPRFVQPVFHFDVSESAEVGTSVGMIQATDQDAGDEGKVYYLFVGSSNDRGFSVTSDTGIIAVSRRLDRETQNRVVLTVMAKNAGGIRGNDTDEAQVIVSIQDGNDPPEFLEKVYEAEVSEAASIGTKLLIVQAQDKDVRPQNNQFSYSIIGGNNEKTFKIDPQSGEIETTLQLDRETIPMYTLTVGAIDTGTPPETGTTVVKITVTDINDNGPVFDPPNVVGYVTENEPPNTSVMTLSATDPDLPPNGAPFTYRLVGGKQQDLVTIENNTGVVRTRISIDRESAPHLDILVEIEDSGKPALRSRHPVSIVVLDQNDTPSTPRSVHILVHAFNDMFPIGKIADVHPNDADTSGDYQCKLVNQPSMRARVFSIPSSCNLHISQVVVGTGYSMSVLGNDGRHPDVTSTVTVEMQTFDNSTVDNSITVRVENTTAQKFLTHFYKGFTDLLKTTFNVGDLPYLYGMNEKDNGLELTIAVKGVKGYQNKAHLLDILTRKQDALQQLLQTSLITVGYSPCQNPICENGGSCSESINVFEETRITDSQTLIFTSPLVAHDFHCRCIDGFTGKKCERRQDPCSPNPCRAGGSCRRQGYDFQCICPPAREGRLCESEKGDACDGNPCRNGGSCRESPDGSSFFCLCRPGYRGNHCETIADSCRPNPCLNGGLCVSLKPGYRCSCTDSRHGRHCEKSTFGFKELSYMTFPPLDASTNDISMIFATTKPDALLVYNFGAQTGGRSDFVAIELVNGKAVFSYGGARTAITSVTVGGNAEDQSLANGEWHKITATRNGRVISLSVAFCTENGDVCQECRPGDKQCYADDIGPAGTLNFNNQPMFVGGLMSADPILERPGQVSSDDLVGCVHSLAVNGRPLNLTNPLRSRGIDPTCGRSSRSPCAASQSTFSSTENSESTSVSSQSSVCGTSGSCYNRWKSVSCMCENSNLISPNCFEALEPVTLTDGGFIEFKISETHRRMQLLDTLYGGSTLWRLRNEANKVKRFATTGSSLANLAGNQPPKKISLMFRTLRTSGLIFFAATNKDYTSLELVGGYLVYVSQLSSAGSPVNMTVNEKGLLSDNQWHNLTMISHNRGLRLMLDGDRVGEELDSAGVHDFLDPYLTDLFLGGVRRDTIRGGDTLPSGFSGCLANFTVNDEVQPMNGSGSIFWDSIQYGKVSPGCTGPVGIDTAASTTDPLSIGISLVLVFFVILLVAILVSFVVFRLRKQKKEKSGGGGNHTKQNGGTTLVTGGLANESGRTGLHPDNTVPSFMTDNGDVIRGVGGHHLVGPELISKRFKDSEVVGPEHQRPQRPDIIEREVVSKSPPPRDEHHPPLPMHHSHDQPAVVGVDSELPEHYDLENASSIAPSDIDIVYHYKGYREGANLRKYKPTPPHLPGAPVHHKHQAGGTAANAQLQQQQQQQHRHSPHHAAAAAAGFPPHSRESPRPPPPVSRVDSPNKISSLQHQSTPLARLSPSSELSQGITRILTLQDISGKPLQSALLATTSSSGGVGKDVLHSNSERSLNSPVMSRLSGQSSSASRKTPNAGQDVGNGGIPIGLTAEEIDRLNVRPRTSSLVSTLDAVSSSSGRGVNQSGRESHRLHHGAVNGGGDHSSTTTDESGNDSFTCSEIEYDNNSVTGEKLSDVIFTKLSPDDERPSRTRNSDTGTPDKPPPPPTSYDGFDSSFRGSLSTLVPSDDDLSHVGGPLYRPQNGSPSSLPAADSWNYLLDWGPDFESLVGVFNDIAELPDSVNGRVPVPVPVPSSLRLPNGATKPSEEYV